LNKDLERLLELEKFKAIAEIQNDIPFSCPEEYKQLKEEIEYKLTEVKRLEKIIKEYTG